MCVLDDKKNLWQCGDSKMMKLFNLKGKRCKSITLNQVQKHAMNKEMTNNVCLM